MKHYSPAGRRNHGRPLKRLLDTWDQNGSTSGPTPWQIYDDDYYYYYYYYYYYFVVFVVLVVECVYLKVLVLAWKFPLTNFVYVLLRGELSSENCIMWCSILFWLCLVSHLFKHVRTMLHTLLVKMSCIT